MAKISIEPSRAKSALGQQDSLANTLTSLYQDVDSIRSGLRYKIAGQENISQRLRESAEQITRESQSTRALQSGLAEIISRYEQTEGNNRDFVVAEKTLIQQSGGDGNTGNAVNWEDVLKAIIPESALLPIGPFYPFFSLVAPLLPFLLQPNLKADGDVKFLTGEAELESKDKVKLDLEKMYGDQDGVFKEINDFTKDHSTKTGSQYLYDQSTGEWTKIDPNDKKAIEEFKKHNNGLPVDVQLFSVGGTASASLLEAEGSLAGDYGGLEGSVHVGEIKGNASAYVGALGVGAAVGASVSILSAEGMGYLGTDDLQAYGKVGVDVGKAEAKGSVNFGLLDGEGKFNPSAYVGAKAEAIAGEVSGSVGVKALGADVALKGSVNIGVGAHANLGFHDGKISVDVGASLGVGASVKLDIDVSGTMDKIGEGIGYVANTAGEIGKGIGERVGNLVSGTKEFFQNLNPFR